MAKTPKRPIAVLHAKKLLRINDYNMNVQLLIKMMGDNASIFVNPSPPLSDVAIHLKELTDAQSKAMTRVTGSVAARDVKFKVVRRDVNSLQRYVQDLSDHAPDVMIALVIIAASGFSVKKQGTISKPPLAAKNGIESGNIKLIARGAGKRNHHEWQMSPNMNNWTDIPSTVKAKTEVKGLKLLTTMYFRHRVITKDGPLEWSFPVSIVVL